MSKKAKIITAVCVVAVVVAAIVGVSLYFELPRGAQDYFDLDSVRRIELIEKGKDPQVTILDEYYHKYFRADLEDLTFKPLVGAKNDDPDRVIAVVDDQGKTLISERQIVRYDRVGQIVSTADVRVGGSLQKLFAYFE